MNDRIRSSGMFLGLLAIVGCGANVVLAADSSGPAAEACRSVSGSSLAGAASAEEGPALVATVVRGKLSGKDKVRLDREEPLEVTIEGLKSWVKEKGTDVSQFQLYLDGRGVEGLPVRLVSLDRETVEFALEHNPKSNPAWKALFARPDRGDRMFAVSVGVDKESPHESRGPKLTVYAFGY